MAFSKSMVNLCLVIFLTRSSLRFLFFLRDLRALGGSFSDLEKTMCVELLQLASFLI